MKKITTRAKTETSAGGIIVCNMNSRWWVLLIKDRGGNWTFPKGKIEKGEDLVTTATREIREEVDIEGLTCLATLTPNKYYYFRDGTIKKTVHFFLFRSPEKNTPTAQIEEGISEAKWVPFAKAASLIGYPKSNKPLLLEAEKALQMV